MRPDLFGASRTKAMLRWLVTQCETTRWHFKARHCRLGGTEKSTHVFDRYMTGRSRGWYVPQDGSHGLIETRVNGLNGRWRNIASDRIAWVGSQGDTFEERAVAWLHALDIPALDRAYQACERLMVNALDPIDEEVSVRWLAAITTDINLRHAARAV